MVAGKKEDFGDELRHQWNRCNAIVQGWIMSSVTQELHTGIVYATSARAVWEDLRERFDKVNESRIYQLYKAIAMNVQDFSMHLERQKLMQFLMGLNENYDQSRSQILMIEPTPNINKAYAMLVEREIQRSMESSSLRGEGTDLAALMAGKGMSHKYNRGTVPQN
ncbi:uncharacterized protein LOC107027684 [Solanum pennellii]|uniref:Uncharacterized protein LOC107027684 n=1 Tax=Solanum pennellii TaxID=28526 RepID=A0ABM1HE89_SOLPN|nr:uncharacterized protein LOC107027684 [Solanum pennellii]